MENYIGRKRVCFFDSGIGGIALLVRCASIMPDVDFYYFADNGNVPYGSLSAERIKSLAGGAFSRMERLKPDAAVIACNTVTAVCAEFLRSEYTFPIIGIQPAIKPAAANGERCVVLATPATAVSASVSSLVEKFGKNHTEVVACPKLAAYIENNIENLDAQSVIDILPEISADSLVLGCTHYVFAEEIIAAHYKIPVYDGLDGTAKRLASVLGDTDLGKTDHFCRNERKISFICGDTARNCRVFKRYYKR